MVLSGFFSSRRRHTRCIGDWSSDVCSSDLVDRGADYVRLIEAFAPVVSYFTVNVSSPNTPGLRDLQQAGALDDLLVRVVAARDRVSLRAGDTPVLVKIAPDLSLSELDDVVAVARRRTIDGMIVSNTTIARPRGLRQDRLARENGGLSGRPLFRLPPPPPPPPPPRAG